MSERIIVIGDVHGCSDELNELVSKLELNPEDHVLFIGDLIDKGPDSIGVIKRVEELKNNFKVTLLLGNHEEKFLRYVNHKRKNSKELSLMSNTDEFELLYSKISPSQLKMLEDSYYTYYLEEQKLLLLHAGIPGNVDVDLKRAIPYTEDAKKHFKNINLILMTRMLDDNGKFVGLNQPGGKNYWAETYNGKFGKVIFGHEAFIQCAPREFPSATGIDTGCVYGGWLTALIMEKGSKESFIQVKANKKYCKYGKG